MGTERLVADRYALAEPVGRGGMGVVWRADDRVLGRPVAVKEVPLQPGLSAEERGEVQERVIREARAAAALNCAGAVTVYDVAEQDGNAYIVMELVEAPTLHDVVSTRGALPPAAVARIGLAVLDVLAVAHAAGIVHRDLKPANVLVTGEAVKLTDFGIAKVKDDPRLTGTGIVLGSPSYLAPEQALGRPVTARTDLWGLGATLFFAACGRPPFDRGEPLATLAAVAHDDLDVDPCAGPLGPVLARMMAKDPERRPGIAALRAELSAVADGTPIPAGTVAAQPVPPAQPTAALAPPRRSRGVTALAAALLVVAVAAIVVVVRDVRRSSPAAHAASGAGTGRVIPVPAGWTTYTSVLGHYVVAHPRGWTRELVGVHRNELREPGTGRFLQVGWADGRTLAATTTTYRGYPATFGEYRRTEDGVRLHGYDLSFFANGRTYTLEFQAREEQWSDAQGLWHGLRDAFRLA